MNKNQRYVTIFSIIGFSILFAFTNNLGLDLTPDSFAYMDTAQALRKFKLPTSFTYWPPFYPLFLAIIDKKYILFFALFTNFFSISTSIFLWLKSGSKYIDNPILFSFFGMFLVLNTPVLVNTHFVWSENLFILLFSTFCYTIFSKKQSFTSITLFYLTGILMCYTRNVGLFILIGCLVFSLFSSQKENTIKLLIIISLGCLWNAYQLFINSQSTLITGLLPYFDISRNLKITFGELYKWFFPSFGFIYIDIIITSFIFVYFVLWAIKSVRKYFYILGGSLFYISCFFLIPASIDDIARLLSIIFYPIVFFIFYSLNNKMNYKKYIFTILLLSITYQVIRVGKNALQKSKSGHLTIKHLDNKL